jgi:hypothetical protein
MRSVKGYTSDEDRGYCLSGPTWPKMTIGVGASHGKIMTAEDTKHGFHRPTDVARAGAVRDANHGGPG